MEEKCSEKIFPEKVEVGKVENDDTKIFLKDDYMRNGLQEVHKSPHFETRQSVCQLKVQVPHSYPIEEIETDSLNNSTDKADSGTNQRARLFYLDNQVKHQTLFFLSFFFLPF